MAVPCSVVIPCHNGAALTRRCIASLLEQSVVPDEILLVDNASTDETAALGAIDARVRVLRQDRNLGFAAGVNAGLRACRNEHALVLNNDTEAAVNLLEEMLRVLDASPAIGAVAPLSNHVKGRARIAVGTMGKDACGRAELAAALAESGPALEDVESLAGLCLLLRRSTLAEVGAFDERFGHGNFEDDDLSLRLRLHGYRLVIARRAFLHHEGHATFRALGLDLVREIERRRAQFVAKWRSDAAGRATIAALRGDLAGAAAAARVARTAWPRWPDADWHLARWCEGNGDPAAAADHYAVLLQTCPWHSEAAIGLCRSLLACGRTRAARSAITRTLATVAVAPGEGAALLAGLGDQEHDGGRFRDACSAFTMALSLMPDDGRLLNRLGASHLADGDLVAARVRFEQAVAAGFALAHTNVGICDHHSGDHAAARRHFERAAELLPDDPVVRRNLATACGAASNGGDAHGPLTAPLRA